MYAISGLFFKFLHAKVLLRLPCAILWAYLSVTSYVRYFLICTYFLYEYLYCGYSSCVLTKQNGGENKNLSNDTIVIGTALDDWKVNIILFEVSLIKLSVRKHFLFSLEIMMNTFHKKNMTLY